MKIESRNVQWDWQKPELTRAGQTKFWDRQAPIYDTADMTTDNSPEIEEVIKYCRQHACKELVTLGSAIGCRDPKMIFEKAYCHCNAETCVPPNSGLPQVFFNDLAESQVKRAKEEILVRCQQCGAHISFYPGPIHEICKQIKRGSRALLLGVYGVESFFSDNPDRNSPLTGFDGYLKNAATLGDYFWFDWLVLHHSRLMTEPTNFKLPATAPLYSQVEFKKVLKAQCVEKLQNDVETIALQIVSAFKNKEGFFISHWYKKEGICRLLSLSFQPQDYEISPVIDLPKGFLAVIKRKERETSGAVTMLNNVLGNIIPDEQLITLDAIKAIM